MYSFHGIQNELDFALRYNWRNLKLACLEALRQRTSDLGGLTDSMRDAEIMGLLDTFVIAERRKSGFVDKGESMSDDGLEGVRWNTLSENENEDEKQVPEDEIMGDMNEDGEDVADETTIDLALLE